MTLAEDTPAPVRARSLLFLPADRLERLAKALDSGAHCVILDLEDAVAPADKPAARAAIARAGPALAAPQRQRVLIRVNATGTPWHDDDAALLRALARDGLGGAMPAKAESVAALARLFEQSGGVALLPLIESAHGLHALDLIARASGVMRLAFGHLDFQLDLGLECGPEESELDSVRLALVMASRRAGLPPPVDGVTASLDDAQRLALDAARGHGARAFSLNGQMIDAPVLSRARRLLD